ncbi:hypothetical protein [Allorhizocola rhizosphaerae]|uniref:hypothetical protein n=1 Tax=Allorhizocola rhizosphaerae TaxID=1872709 RepID=UPI000E3EE2FA|nr:hypothetical protein [Allorhizocola rhizosphaerae]
MLLPRIVWEAVLLGFAVAVAAGLLLSTEFAMGLSFWYAFATLGLLAAGFALSVRTGTPNLAIASIASLSGVVYAKVVQADQPVVIAGALAVGLALVIGLVLGVVTGVLSAPAWAVSLGGFAVVMGIALAVADARGVPVVGAGRPGWFGALLWSLVFVAGSVAGGLLFLQAKVRAFLGGQRLVAALAGLAGSSLLAGISGVVWASWLGASFPGGDLQRLFLAVAAAVLGGVSLARGGVGGYVGTVLATALLLLLDMWVRVVGLEAPWGLGLSGLAIVIGLLVSQLLDRLSPSPAPARTPAADVSG